jgi:site-specific recombinase XerD
MMVPPVVLRIPDRKDHHTAVENNKEERGTARQGDALPCAERLVQGSVIRSFCALLAFFAANKWQNAGTYTPFFMDTSFLSLLFGGRIETLQQAIRLFATTGMPAKNLSSHTRKNYLHDLQDLLQFLTERGMTKLVDVSLRHLQASQVEMDRRGYASSTRNRKTQSIRILFQFLHVQGITEHNIASQLIPPSIQKQEPRFLSEAEYQRLLRAASHNARDAAMIELFLQTGMRLSELAKLQLTDIEIPKRITMDIDNMGLVRIRRKGGKTAAIPLNYKACRALAAYLQVRPEVGQSALFISQFRKPMSTRAIQHRITKYLKEAGITGASVHTLRHTVATHHVARGTDLKTVQETLGHADLATTTIYVSLAKTAQKKALQEHAL